LFLIKLILLFGIIKGPSFISTSTLQQQQLNEALARRPGDHSASVDTRGKIDLSKGVSYFGFFFLTLPGGKIYLNIPRKCHTN